jgi:hypothetical protein
MRIYIIGNDGITLCREPPTAVNAGEIAVASNEELHAAALSGKRLLALWNALPAVEKRRKVGDRGTLIDQLWSAIEALPEPKPPSDAKRPSARRVDIVVVYKIDRLTRSLTDFAKIVEIFDARGASFVSVTQQFNTTTSMGRLAGRSDRRQTAVARYPNSSPSRFAADGR